MQPYIPVGFLVDAHSLFEFVLVPMLSTFAFRITGMPRSLLRRDRPHTGIDFPPADGRILGAIGFSPRPAWISARRPPLGHHQVVAVFFADERARCIAFPADGIGFMFEPPVKRKPQAAAGIRARRGSPAPPARIAFQQRT